MCRLDFSTTVRQQPDIPATDPEPTAATTSSTSADVGPTESVAAANRAEDAPAETETRTRERSPSLPPPASPTRYTTAASTQPPWHGPTNYAPYQPADNIYARSVYPPGHGPGAVSYAPYQTSQGLRNLTSGYVRTPAYLSTYDTSAGFHILAAAAATHQYRAPADTSAQGHHHSNGTSSSQSQAPSLPPVNSLMSTGYGLHPPAIQRGARYEQVTGVTYDIPTKSTRKRRANERPSDVPPPKRRRASPQRESPQRESPERESPARESPERDSPEAIPTIERDEPAPVPAQNKLRLRRTKKMPSIRLRLNERLPRNILPRDVVGLKESEAVAIVLKPFVDLIGHWQWHMDDCNLEQIFESLNKVMKDGYQFWSFWNRNIDEIPDIPKTAWYNSDEENEAEDSDDEEDAQGRLVSQS